MKNWKAKKLSSEKISLEFRNGWHAKHSCIIDTATTLTELLNFVPLIYFVMERSENQGFRIQRKTRDGFHAKVTKEWNSYFFHKDCFFAWWNCSISTQKSTNDDDFTVTKMLQFPNECQELANWIFAFWIFCHGALSKREIMKCLKPLIFFLLWNHP